MNEGGYSWSEAILTLMIVMTVFGTLLPLATTMTLKLQMKKSQMYAAETALQGLSILRRMACWKVAVR